MSVHKEISFDLEICQHLVVSVRDCETYLALPPVVWVNYGQAESRGLVG